MGRRAHPCPTMDSMTLGVIERACAEWRDHLRAIGRAESPGAKPRVAVSVDGTVLGSLTPATSQHVLTYVRVLDGKGVLPVAAAEVEYLPGAAKVTLLVRKAGDALEWFSR